ncbi:hypothetical protein L3K75_09930 [[Ruminococcus] lactaris]|nr:hypothetical protein [[Ruminococcus] lactaris]
MSNSIFEGNIWDLRTGNDGESEPHEEAVVGEVVEAMSDDNDAEAGSLFDILARMKGIIDDGDDEADDDDYVDENGMDADDYHNKAVEFARHGKYKRSTEICMDGLKRFPLNVDLLADTIKYNAEAGDLDTASEHYEVLKKSVPVQRWNWRAFTFAFDYLLEVDPITNEEECRRIVENYKKYIPYEEKAYMAESELEMALGNSERSMSVLEAAIAARENASQCALRLADMQLDRGLYENVIATTNYGIAASAETQPSINVPYLYYIRALAKDHLIHKKECNGEVVEQKEVDALSAEYNLMLSEFPELMRHAHTIKMRAKMLKFMKIA